LLRNELAFSLCHLHWDIVYGIRRWCRMKIGLWNVDHPETGSGRAGEEKRFDEVVRYLGRCDCDLLITTEGNAAIGIPDYLSEFSDLSPFRSTRRFYGPPNLYHQVGIYSRIPIRRKPIAEPINGLLCEVSWMGNPLMVYGNVITIKDQWNKSSEKTHKDRLQEQLTGIESLRSTRFVVGGDFNLSLGWTRMLSAHREVKSLVDRVGLVWPTERRDDTVQHFLHSPDLDAKVEIDFSLKHLRGGERRLSDHPFLTITIDSSRKT
jgi:hypothetical protein